MPKCPRCDRPMVEIAVDSARPEQLRVWTCTVDPITAEARHPVQIVHIAVGQEEIHSGHRRRVIAKEIIGAELIVFHEVYSD